MNLSSILLTIISKMDGERTIYAGLHLLRGKRSGQTLQDINHYGVQKFFGILPKLSTALFDDAARQLTGDGAIRVAGDSLVSLTVKGLETVAVLPIYHFNGHDYRGREMIFFSRLSLLVQTVSNFKSGEKSFLPVEKDSAIQSFVKKMLTGRPIGDPAFASRIADELRQSLHRSQMSDVQKVIVTHRLAGHRLSGWTWDQLAAGLKLNPVTVRLLFIEGLHMLLEAIHLSEDTPVLRKLIESIKVSTYLTDSSMKTKQLFERGLSMDEIAATRQLKMSTIEDHFVEMAINDPHFPIGRFIAPQDIEAVVTRVKMNDTKRLRLLKSEFESLSYFQLRLILGARTGGKV